MNIHRVNDQQLHRKCHEINQLRVLTEMTEDFIKNFSLLKVLQFKNEKWKVFIQKCNCS